MASKTTDKNVAATPNTEAATPEITTHIRVYADGTVGLGDGTSLTWEAAHKIITDARTDNRVARKTAAAARKEERGKAKAEKLAAKATKLREQLAALEAATATA